MMCLKTNYIDIVVEKISMNTHFEDTNGELKN